MTLKEIIQKFGIPVTYLNPCKLEANNSRSKMGGDEAFVINDIDKCGCCNLKMTLIIEIFKEEFPNAYFPENCDYMQVKTCYNSNCPFDQNGVIEFKIGFGAIKNLTPNQTSTNSHIPSVYFNPENNFEIPIEYIKKAETVLYESQIDKYTARIGTKINGDVFAWHKFEIPMCSCGNKMQQILQISSYEPCLNPDEKKPYWEWDSSIGVFIAHLGNYHFFKCKNCPEKPIKYEWDSI